MLFRSMATVVLGAVMNVVLNILLIPNYGANGAAFATAISYVAMFLIRAINSRKYINIKWKYARFIVSSFVLVLQCYFMLQEVMFWIPIQILLCAVIIVLNGDDLISAFNKLFSKFLYKMANKT